MGDVTSAQLDLVMRPHGRHRAEVAKVMVHRSADSALDANAIYYRVLE